MFAYCNNNPVLYQDPHGTTLGAHYSKNGLVEYTDARTGTPLGVPIRTVRVYENGLITTTHYFRSKQSATVFIQRNDFRIDSPISAAGSALTGFSYVLSRSFSKVQRATKTPVTFMGSEVLASAGAVDLAAGVVAGYEIAVYIHNYHKSIEAEELQTKVSQLNGNRVAVTVLGWDTGSYRVSVGTW